MVWPSAYNGSGTKVPNANPCTNLTPPRPIFQCARENNVEYSSAKNSASGSPSVYRIFTDPGLIPSQLIRVLADDWSMVRHDTSFFILSLSKRALAASFSSEAARSFAFAATPLASSRALSQYASFTLPVLTITNVASTPATRLAIKTILATSHNQLAVSKDISKNENGHIRFPDWLFWGGIRLRYFWAALLRFGFKPVT